jgi:very-short-patch-repair endonuclease
VKEHIRELLRDGSGVIRRRDQSTAVIQQLDRLRARGELVTLLPGILTTPELESSWPVRLAAGLAWLGPDAIVTRRSAARLTFWPDCDTELVELSLPQSPLRPRKGWSVSKGRIPPEWLWQRDGTRLTCAAYTAVELAAEPDAGDIIDRALRSKQATLDQMWKALQAMPGRRGNSVRADLLRDSRDKPWSELERLAHRLLRQNRIKGWRTNVWVRTGSGGCFADVFFPGSRLIVEFDGWEFHSDRAAFEDDRRRRNELVLAGYRVLNFTWLQLIDDPKWVLSCIRRALRAAA